MVWRSGKPGKPGFSMEHKHLVEKKGNAFQKPEISSTTAQRPFKDYVDLNRIIANLPIVRKIEELSLAK